MKGKQYIKMYLLFLGIAVVANFHLIFVALAILLEASFSILEETFVEADSMSS